MITWDFNESYSFVHIKVLYSVLTSNEATFSLSTVLAVEIQYELYNPTIQSIEVLLLEKRLDRNLLYLRDAPLDESRFPFDMSRIPYNPSDPVPINDKKVCFYHNNIGKFYLLVVISCYLSYLFVAVVVHFEKTC